MMRRRLVEAILVAGACACASSPPTASSTPTAAATPTATATSQTSSAMTVSVLSETQRGGKTVPFASGESLKSKERFAISVWVDQPALLWVLYCSSDKKLSLVHPAKGAPVVADPAKKTRVPRDGDWFELDEHTGAETLYVIASRGTLADVDADVARTLDKLTGSSDLTCEPDPQAGVAPTRGLATDPTPSATTSATTATPPTAAPKGTFAPIVKMAPPRRANDDKFLLTSRGFKVVSGGGDDKSGACRATPEGLAVCRLWFKHE